MAEFRAGFASRSGSQARKKNKQRTCLCFSGLSLGTCFEQFTIVILILFALSLSTFGLWCEAKDWLDSLSGKKWASETCFLRKEFSRSLMISGLITLFPLLVLFFASRRKFFAPHIYFNSSSQTSSLKFEYDSAEENRDDDELNWFVRPSAVPVEQADRTRQWLRYILYLEVFFTTTGQQMWQFVLPIVLIDIFTNTLLPGALLGILTALAGSVVTPL